MESQKTRKTELHLTDKVYITEEAKQLLRELKKSKRKSMAQIVIDLIVQEAITEGIERDNNVESVEVK